MSAVLSALLIVVPALADPPEGFRVTKEGVSGCTLMLGTAESDGVVPMRAECTWIDVDLAHFDGLFAKWEDHDLMFSSIESSDLLGVEGERTVFRQIHTTRGIADREIALGGKRLAVGDGFRYEWTKVSRNLTVPDSRVEAVRSDGFWEVHPHPGGGIDVVHQLAYDPGGSVPGFVVKWFQTSGLSAIVSDLHDYMTDR